MRHCDRRERVPGFGQALVRGLRLALPAALPSEDVAELFQALRWQTSSSGS